MSANLTAPPGVAESRLSTALDVSLVSIARDLAQDIHDPDDVIRSHGFTGINDPRWQFIARSPEFIRLHSEQVAEWSSVNSTPKRVRAKALAAVEAAIPHMFSIVADAKEQGDRRVKASQHLMSLAGMGQNGPNSGQAQGGGGGSTFSVTINMPTGQTVKVLDARLNSATGKSIGDSGATVIDGDSEEDEES